MWKGSGRHGPAGREAAVADDGTAKWNFQLHANHLDATDLDRWMGTTRQARLAYNACSLLAGRRHDKWAASELLQRVNAEGDLSVDEFRGGIKRSRLRASRRFA